MNAGIYINYSVTLKKEGHSAEWPFALREVRLAGAGQ